MLGVVLATLACSSDPDGQCYADRARVEACDRVYTGDDDPCATAGSRCATACYAQLDCRQWEALERDGLPPWLGRCLGLCVDPFECGDGTAIDQSWTCDAERDCVDGSDEEDCEYFRCDDGEAVPRDYECDEYADCADRSDERKCGYFLCHDDSMTVPEEERCDGDPACDDGSDEENCP